MYSFIWCLVDENYLSPSLCHCWYLRLLGVLSIYTHFHQGRLCDKALYWKSLMVTRRKQHAMTSIWGYCVSPMTSLSYVIASVWVRSEIRSEERHVQYNDNHILVQNAFLVTVAECRLSCSSDIVSSALGTPSRAGSLKRETFIW